MVRIDKVHNRYNGTLSNNSPLTIEHSDEDRTRYAFRKPVNTRSRQNSRWTIHAIKIEYILLVAPMNKRFTWGIQRYGPPHAGVCHRAAGGYAELPHETDGGGGRTPINVIAVLERHGCPCFFLVLWAGLNCVVACITTAA